MFRLAAGKLFLKFLAILVPGFLLLSSAGLFMLSRYQMRDGQNELERVSLALNRWDSQVFVDERVFRR